MGETYSPAFKRSFAIEWDAICKIILGEDRFREVRRARKAEIEKEKEEEARRRSREMAEALKKSQEEAKAKADALARGVEIYEEPESLEEIVDR